MIQSHQTCNIWRYFAQVRVNFTGFYRFFNTKPVKTDIFLSLLGLGDLILTDLKIEQGKRLRALREIAGLTQKELSELSKVAESTIRQWETGRSNGISIKGAYKVVKACNSCNIICDADWLLDGKGNAPKYTSGYQPKSTVKAQTIYIEKQIEEEIKFFCEQSYKPIFFRIEDNSMLPYYQLGTYVGGTLCSEKEIKNLNNRNCIVVLISNQFLVRKVKVNKKTGKVSLYATNEKQKEIYPTLHNVEVLSLALITRVWIPVSTV